MGCRQCVRHLIVENVRSYSLVRATPRFADAGFVEQALPQTPHLIVEYIENPFEIPRPIAGMLRFWA